jgi:OOP family OmpA-OmpF porin
LNSAKNVQFLRYNNILNPTAYPMKRILLLLSFSLTTFLTTSAQSRIGLLIGGHQATVQEKNDLPDWESIKGNYKGRTGLRIGFIADMPLGTSRFYFQPAVFLSNKGRKYAQVFDTTVSQTLSVSSHQFVNYIDIPLNLVYKIPIGRTTKFVIGAGPYLSFFYSAKHKTETFSKDGQYTLEEDNDPGVGKEPGDYKIYDYGVNGTAGFEFGRVFLTAHYAQGLGNFYKPVDYTASQFRHRTVGATLGIFLGKQPEVAPRDQDKDGIPDKDDKCPTLPGPAALNGCPDADGDGVADPSDRCPAEAGPVENQGCPWPDRDKDGIADKDDACPDQPGLPEDKGCPPADSDGDGVPDKVDKCPQQAGVARYDGCPVPDTDGDGVNDDEDKCPTKAGTRANNGCPEEVKKEVVEKINYAAGKVQFAVNKAVLTPASKKVLDGVADILRQQPELKLAIGGHTSSDGSRELNLRLSQQRADAVKNYLISKGIEAERLSATGYGPDQPLNEGKTAVEKAQNRRVEMVVSNQ